MDAAKTDSEYINTGLNTLITAARIRWAVENELSWVLTHVSSGNLSSLRAKLKAGFILNTSLCGLELVYPISSEAQSSVGMHPNIPPISYSLLQYTPTIDLSTVLPRSYGVLDPETNSNHGQVTLRMIPRVFGTSREM